MGCKLSVPLFTTRALNPSSRVRKEQWHNLNRESLKPRSTDHNQCVYCGQIYSRDPKTLQLTGCTHSPASLLTKNLKLLARNGEGDVLTAKVNIRMMTKEDLRDFERGLVIGALRVGLFLQTADLVSQ